MKKVIVTAITAQDDVEYTNYYIPNLPLPQYSP